MAYFYALNSVLLYVLLLWFTMNKSTTARRLRRQAESLLSQSELWVIPQTQCELQLKAASLIEQRRKLLKG